MTAVMKNLSNGSIGMTRFRLFQLDWVWKFERELSKGIKIGSIGMTRF